VTAAGQANGGKKQEDPDHVPVCFGAPRGRVKAIARAACRRLVAAPGKIGSVCTSGSKLPPDSPAKMTAVIVHMANRPRILNPRSS
jgi:hypothetical protein